MRTQLWKALRYGLLAGCAVAGATLPAAALDLTVGRVVVTQATQNAADGIPLVANRRALVRVFVLANGDNRVRPQVRVRVQNGKKVRFQGLADAPVAFAGVPTALTADAGAPAWTVTIPAAVVQPGNSLSVEVDPDRRVRDTNRGNNLWPGPTPKALAVTVSAPLRLTLVPLHRALNGATSAYQPSLSERYVDFTRRVHPVPEVLEVSSHAPFSTREDLATREGWTAALLAIEVVRVAEGQAGRHYAGLVPVPSVALSGLGYLGGFSVLSVDGPQSFDGGRTRWQSYVLAHELGHNFGRNHAPCGGAGGPDPSYPYPLASIGVPGNDVFTGASYDPRGVTADLMSYCNFGVWISDFNYYREIEWRNRNVPSASPPSTASRGAAGSSLLVWGRIEGDRVILEPAFRVAVPPDLSDATAPLEVEILGREGRPLVRHGFWPLTLDHQPGLAFAVVVPLPPGETLSGLRLHGEGKLLAERRPVPASAVSAAVQAARTAGGGLELRWPAASSPLAVVRDADSGEILTLGREGLAEIAAQPAGASRLEVTFSDGVDSRTERLDVP
jgi:hypothetical protein